MTETTYSPEFASPQRVVAVVVPVPDVTRNLEHARRLSERLGNVLRPHGSPTRGDHVPEADTPR